MVKDVVKHLPSFMFKIVADETGDNDKKRTNLSSATNPPARETCGALPPKSASAGHAVVRQGVTFLFSFHHLVV